VTPSALRTSQASRLLTSKRSRTAVNETSIGGDQPGVRRWRGVLA
jgi:hypothetical protein